MNLTRRQWIGLASAASAGQLLRGPCAYGGTHFSQIRGEVGHLTDSLFVEIPPSASGISWVHENAMSPSRYLPEALGPGCAFLDFDNDGWMDIFLVNSGPSDFWKPTKPVRNALYKNNRDGTFTDVTEKAGVGGAYFGMGVAVGDYDNDGWPEASAFSTRTITMERLLTLRTTLVWRLLDGRLVRSGSTTTTMAGWICLSAVSWIIRE